jgi:YD repeat-containing protein
LSLRASNAFLSEQEMVTRFTYEERFNRLKTKTDPAGNVTTYVYDYEEGVGEAGNLIRIISPAVADERGVLATPTISYSYNALGLVETATDARGVVTRYIYTQGTPEEAETLFAPGLPPVPAC